MNVPILVNGVSYSWNETTWMWYAVPVVGIVDISYKKKQKKENNMGSGPLPISRGYGNYEFEASITIYKEEWNRIIAAAPQNNPMLIPPSDMQCVFGGDRINVSGADVLKMAEILEDPFEVKQGDGRILIKIPLLIADIEHK